MNKLSKNDSKNLKKALETNSMDLLKTVPKSDLHAHSFLSAEYECVQSVFEDLERPPERFESLHDFIAWLTVNVKRPSYELDYVKILNNVFARMLRDGVTYGEISFDFKECIALQMKPLEWVGLIHDVYSPYADKMTINFEFGINRADDPKESIKRLESVMGTGYFTSLDLYGDELCRPVGEFKDIFKLAKANCMKCKCHVGEIGSAKDVVEAISLLHLDAVQHGVAISKDKEIMKYVADKGIILNTCVASNISLRVADDFKNHPIRELFDNGIKVSLNTDDYLLFSKNVSDDIMALYKNDVFSVDELEKIINNGLSENLMT